MNKELDPKFQEVYAAERDKFLEEWLKAEEEKEIDKWWETVD